MHRVFIMVVLFLYAGLSVAQDSANIYVAVVPVANHSNQALKTALPNALGQVLIKVSGNTGVVTLPYIQASLADANRLLQSYSYQRNDNNNEANPLFIKAHFNKTAVDDLLRRAGQAIWSSSDRPLILAWISVRTPRGAQVLSSDDGQALVARLKQSAFGRGLSLLLPAMDLQDQADINSDPSKPFDLKKLQASASRYGVSAVLAGEITLSDNGQAQSRWLLYYDGQSLKWGAHSESQDTLISQGVNKAADLLANRLAVIENNNLSTNVSLEIANVNDLQAYTQVINVLRHLRPVASVSVTDMGEGNIVLTVRTVGGSEVLANALRRHHQFQSVSQALLTATQRVQADLYYRWVK